MRSVDVLAVSFIVWVVLSPIQAQTPRKNTPVQEVAPGYTGVTTWTTDASWLSAIPFQEERRPVSFGIRSSSPNLSAALSESKRHTLSTDSITPRVNMSLEFDCAGLPCTSPFEPAVAMAGQSILIVGNFLALSSDDGGRTWNGTNPETSQPGFCCDQDVVFAPAINRFLWWRQGSPSLLVVSQVNSTQIAWAYPIRLQDFNSAWSSESDDYPKLDVTQKYLVMTTSGFSSGGYQRSIIARFLLSELNSNATLTLSFTWTTDSSIALATEPFANGFFYAHELPQSECCAIGFWSDDSETAISAERIIPFVWFTKHEATCPDGDGRDPCQEMQVRIQNGWVSRGRVGFPIMQRQLPAPAGNPSTKPYPYVLMPIFNTTDLNIISATNAIWSTDHALTYPFTSTNSRGDVVMSYYGMGGDGLHKPFFAVDVLNSNSIVPLVVNTSTHNVPNGWRWGDYTRARPVYPSATSFVTVGYTLQQDIGPCSSTPTCEAVAGHLLVVDVPSETPPAQAPSSLPSPTSQPPSMPSPSLSPPSSAPQILEQEAPTAPITDTPSSSPSTTPSAVVQAPLAAPDAANNNNPTPDSSSISIIGGVLGALLGAAIIGVAIAIAVKRKQLADKRKHIDRL